jgi:hypothetical protein
LFGDRVISNLKYTKEYITNYIKEHPEINSRKKLEQHNRSMYMAAKDLNLLDDLFGEKQHKTWNEKTITDFVKSNNITKRKQLEKEST